MKTVKIYFKFIFLFAVASLKALQIEAQPTINAIVDNNNSNGIGNCKVRVYSTFSTAISDNSNGIFYRLDGGDATNGTHWSYYWDDVISNGNTISSGKDFQLPAGKYTIVAYQTKKSGPIDTGHGIKTNQPTNQTVLLTSPQTTFNMPNTPNSCDINIEPIFTNVSNQPPVILKASWNVFTDNFYSDGSPDQSHFLDDNLLMNAVTTSQEPWIFVTLSVSKLESFSNDNIQVSFDNGNLKYIGAIADNMVSNNIFTNTNFNYIQSVNYNSGDPFVTVTRKPGGLPKEVHVHLMFQTLPNAILGSSTSFTAIYYPANSTTKANTTVQVPVKGQPHDPNSLDVDKKFLCPCQDEEVLEYQVNYQNVGSAPATSVDVELKDFAPWLDPQSIQVVKNFNNYTKTFLHNKIIKYTPPSINKGPVFSIIEDPNDLNNSSINLLGANPSALNPPPIPEFETMDYFKFRIKKRGCSPARTVIQPKVDIVFYDTPNNPMTTIPTNLSKTEVIQSKGETFSCDKAPSSTCQTKCYRRRCWLLRLFH